MTTKNVYIQGSDGSNLLPVTDWSNLLNVPSVLQSPDKIKTTDNLLSDTGWITDGVTLGSNTTAANTNANSQPKYRVITIGSVKLVMLQGTISGGTGDVVTYPSEIGLPVNTFWVSVPTNTTSSLKFVGNSITSDGTVVDYTNYYLMYPL